MIKSKRVEWAESVACMGKMRIVYTILIIKPEVRSSLEMETYMAGQC
jgi:hypothetical protein